MLKFEAKLIDPSAEQIADTLSTATTGANKRCRSRKLADDPARWRRFARVVAAAAEGFDMWRGGRGGTPASQVVGAWWTDHAGRKHVVVRGRRIEDHAARRALDRKELDDRCPLWHAYPEYVYRRTAGAKTEWVCACGCGAVGTPAALGWMGECCGPCFDRREEHGDDALRGNLPGVLYGEREPILVVACSPDGRRVAAKEGNRRVNVWDTRTQQRWGFEGAVGSVVHDLAVTSDGRYLLDAGAAVLTGGVSVYDLAADPPNLVPTTRSFQEPFYRVVPLRDPGLAVVCRGNYGESLVELFRVHLDKTGWDVDNAGWEVTLPPEVPPDSSPLTVSPDDEFVAVGVPDEVRILRRATGIRITAIPVPASALAFTPDGKRLLIGVNAMVVAYRTDSWVYAGEWSLDPGRRSWVLATPPRVAALCAAPDGSAVYASDERGRLYALNAKSLALRARFDWHLGAVPRLAITADGETLFSAGADGVVKLWPIRRLLGGV